MNEILAIAKKHNLKVIEDAAHVFGARYKGKIVGNIGDYTCFSFQAVKQLTTGDGGALVCKNKKDYELAKKIKWFGMDKTEHHRHANIWMDDISVLGYKGNMNDISAAIGITQMKYFGEIIRKYHRNGELYSKLLRGTLGVELIERDKENYPVYWTYVILCENRDKIMQVLGKHGVASGIVHPRNDSYSLFKKFKRDLPAVDYYSTRELSLPCGWWVGEKEIRRIAGIIKNSISGHENK